MWQHDLEKSPTAQKESMNLRENFTEQLQTSTFLKVFGSMFPLLARLHLVNSNLWKDPQKLSLLLLEMRISILQSLKIF